MDNSTILLLRLLNDIGVKNIGIAGFDGYSYDNNYAEKKYEVDISVNEAMFINKELEDMLNDFIQTKHEDISVKLITESKLSIR